MDPFEASPQQDPLGAKLCEERMPLMPWDFICPTWARCPF